EVIIYINHRYDTAIAALSRCLLLHAEACGPFSVSIERSGGAYRCGEETALVASLEGKRAIPRERPYDLLRQGFLGLPTLVHNVE
ncbi:NADH-quinone oxidoreductase subunit L, partial [Acinetobacter baumannii]